MADEIEAGNALQGDPTDIVITAEDSAAADQVAEQIQEQAAEETPQQEELELGQAKESKDPDAWKMKRLHEETNKRKALEDRLARTAREAEEAKQLLIRLQGKQDGDSQTKAPEVDFDAAVKAEVARQRLHDDSLAIKNAGLRSFPDFSESLRLLSEDVGLITDEFVQDLIDTDHENSHKLLDYLAKNPERALSLREMNSRRRVAELTRISMSELNKPATNNALQAAPKPAPVSKVPAPRPVVEATRSVEEKAEDEMSDQEWSAWRKKQMQKAG